MRSMSKSKLLQGMVDTARDNLEAMPAPPRDTKVVSLREAIQALTPTIAKLMKRGHSRESVLALLKEQGIECSEATFRSVYRAPKARTQGTKAPFPDRGERDRPSRGPIRPAVDACTPPPPSPVIATPGTHGVADRQAGVAANAQASAPTKA